MLGTKQQTNLVQKMAISEFPKSENDANSSRYWRNTDRDRNATRATLGEGLAVSAFPLYVPV